MISFIRVYFQFIDNARLLDLARLWITSHLPEKEWLFIFLSNVAEACKEKQQFFLKLSRCTGCYVPLQEFRVIVVHCFDDVVTRPLHQDPIGVHDKFSQRRVKSCFISKLVQRLHEVIIPLGKMKSITFICLSC